MGPPEYQPGFSIEEYLGLTYISDLRVATSRNRYVYPDVTVVCGKVTYFEELKNAANNNIQDSVQRHSLDVQLSLEDIYLSVAFLPFDEENWKLI